MNATRLLLRSFAGVGSTWFCAVAGRTALTALASSRPAPILAPVSLSPAVIAVADGLWRGPAPNQGGYAELAAAGVTSVIDLRAEADPDAVQAMADHHGLRVLSLPIGDGRPPHRDDLVALTHHLESSHGVTYVHCQAGEGRTGTLLAAYHVSRGAPLVTSVLDALKVGSLTFAQLSFVTTLGRAPLLDGLIDLTIDRPTEALFDLARTRGSRGATGVSC